MVLFCNEEKLSSRNSQMTFLFLFLSLIKDSLLSIIQVYETFRHFEKAPNSHFLLLSSVEFTWLNCFWNHVTAVWIQRCCVCFLQHALIALFPRFITNFHSVVFLKLALIFPQLGYFCLWQMGKISQMGSTVWFFSLKYNFLYFKGQFFSLGNEEISCIGAVNSVEG